MDHDLPSVAVIIPSYCEQPYLAEVLSAILKGKLKPDEIIVSHSGPIPLMPSLIEDFSKVKFIETRARLFAGAARNKAARTASSQILVFCDSDVRPANDWLEAILRPLLENPKSLAVGSIGVAQTGGYWGMSNWFCEFSELASFNQPRDQGGGGAGNLAVYAEAFWDAGGFSEDQMVSEDTLLLAKLREAGNRQKFVPSAKVLHYNNAGFIRFVLHQFALGKGFPISRRNFPELPGFWLSQRPAMAPVLAIPKAGVVLLRLLKAGWASRCMAFKYLPGIIFGSAAWALGAAKQAHDMSKNP